MGWEPFAVHWECLLSSSIIPTPPTSCQGGHQLKGLLVPRGTGFFSDFSVMFGAQLITVSLALNTEFQPKKKWDCRCR